MAGLMALFDWRETAIYLKRGSELIAEMRRTSSLWRDTYSVYVGQLAVDRLRPLGIATTVRQYLGS